ncbi:Uncharacterised protein [Mycobacteroides abscessus]|nr:Uncharacterised protein [Mycobacteroides abscessus]
MASAHGAKDSKETAMKNPFDWFFRAALMVLGASIALNIAVCLLSQIWLFTDEGVEVVGASLPG